MAHNLATHLLIAAMLIFSLNAMFLHWDPLVSMKYRSELGPNSYILNMDLKDYQTLEQDYLDEFMVTVEILNENLTVVEIGRAHV